MRIKITSDSTCDLTAQLIKEYDITIQPLSVIKDGESFRDGINITPDVIFAHVAAGGSLCSTSAVNIGEYQELFSRFSSEYDALIHITIGSGFSTCYQNACLAADDFENVRVIDSKNLSTGQGHVVLAACQLARELDDLDQICNKLNDLADRVEASFLLNRLDYMVKGGRCSSVVALGANLLNLKPCIEVKGGKMQVVKKYRGAYDKCLGNYVKDRLDGREDIIRDRLFLTYTTVDPDCYKAVNDAINQYGHFNTVTETTAGCTISCHCGPSTLGILFIRK